MSGRRSPGTSRPPRPVSAGTASRRRPRVVAGAVLALPLIELVLLILAGRVIGVPGTLLALAVAALAGVVVIRRAVRGREASAERATPGDVLAGDVLTGVPIGPARSGLGPGAPADTALLIAGGLLLVVPGFLSDLVGLALLIPGVRRGIVARAGDAVLRRVGGRFAPPGVRIVPGEVVPGGVVTGEVVTGEVVTGDVVTGRPALPPGTP